MSKIVLNHEKKEYVLEYSRQSVKTMESQGFVLDEITEEQSKYLKKVTHINSGSIWVVKCLELFTPSSCFSVISRDFLDVCVLICNEEKKNYS